jgi:hypothetical protein
MLPASVLKRDYKSWNHNQIIDYWWSGNINEGPDDLGFSLADNPYLPPSVAFGGRFAHNYQAPAPVQVQAQVPAQAQVLAQVPIEINEDLFKNEDEFITLPDFAAGINAGKPKPSSKTSDAW